MTELGQRPAALPTTPAEQQEYIAAMAFEARGIAGKLRDENLPASHRVVYTERLVQVTETLNRHHNPP